MGTLTATATEQESTDPEKPYDDFDEPTHMYREVPDAVPDPVGTTYMLYWAHGGTWCDAEKTADNTDDDLMCWAAAASNVLEWTGWGVTDGMVDTDDMFAHFNYHFYDGGGYTGQGWKWWFDGTPPDAPGIHYAGGGDFWDPPYSFSDYYHEHEPDDTVLQAIDDYMHAGWGTALSIYHPSYGGHAITCWGYTYDSGGYTGVYVTDSDDDKDYNSWDPPPDSLRYYAVQKQADNKWHLLNYYGSNDYYIRRVYGLEPKPAASAPATGML